jgi:hypothetical protein
LQVAHFVPINDEHIDDSGDPLIIHRLVPALPVEQLGNLPTVRICKKQIEDALVCSICLDNFVHEELVAKLDCQHLFHAQCVRKWLANEVLSLIKASSDLW